MRQGWRPCFTEQVSLPRRAPGHDMAVGVSPTGGLRLGCGAARPLAGPGLGRVEARGVANGGSGAAAHVKRPTSSRCRTDLRDPSAARRATTGCARSTLERRLSGAARFSDTRGGRHRWIARPVERPRASTQAHGCVRRAASPAAPRVQHGRRARPAVARAPAVQHERARCDRTTKARCRGATTRVERLACRGAVLGGARRLQASIAFFARHPQRTTFGTAEGRRAPPRRGSCEAGARPLEAVKCRLKCPFGARDRRRDGKDC